jgi:hypothetical protein
MAPEVGRREKTILRYSMHKRGSPPKRPHHLTAQAKKHDVFEVFRKPSKFVQRLTEGVDHEYALIFFILWCFGGYIGTLVILGG